MLRAHSMGMTLQYKANQFLLFKRGFSVRLIALLLISPFLFPYMHLNSWFRLISRSLDSSFEFQAFLLIIAMFYCSLQGEVILTVILNWSKFQVTFLVLFATFYTSFTKSTPLEYSCGNFSYLLFQIRLMSVTVLGFQILSNSTFP